jgi:hypothetical protein
MPYTYGFVYDQPAIADAGLGPVCQDFTQGTKPSRLQNTYQLFIVWNQQGLLTGGPSDDTDKKKLFPDRKAAPQDVGE